MRIDDAPPFCLGNHVMIDIETLSTHPTAVITSIGACKFTFIGGIGDTFKMNVNPVDGKKLGLNISPSTIDWWSKQSHEARMSWQSNPQPLVYVLTEFKEWLGDDSKQQIWCKGGSFDFPILASSYVAIGSEKPWSHWQEMDLRTVFKVVGFDQTARKQRQTDTQYHDALGDAIAQTKQLLSLFDIEPF